MIIGVSDWRHLLARVYIDQVLKANRKKDNKAKTIIYQGLNEAIF